MGASPAAKERARGESETEEETKKKICPWFCFAAEKGDKWNKFYAFLLTFYAISYIII